jgi:hypothetical protein
MSRDTIVRMVQAHGVPHRLIGGRVELYEDRDGRWVDATRWALGDLMAWMGY